MQKRNISGGSLSRKGGEKTDYKRYRFTRMELLRFWSLYLLLDGAVSYLFYRSAVAFFLLLPGVYFYLKIIRESRRKRVLTELSGQFLTGMQAVSGALAAGYSVENAFGEAYKEVRKVYGEDVPIVKEFALIVSRLSLNRPLEELLLELAERSGQEDIESFAEVFAVAKRSGGDLISIIRGTVSAISRKEETRQEIRVCLASRRLEQNVMSLMPLLILAYVGLASPGFLDALYGNPAGIAIMTACLLVYLLAWALGRKITEIEV